MYPVTVQTWVPHRKATGRPPIHPIPSGKQVQAKKLVVSLGPRAFRTITWRNGTKGELSARFVAVRVPVLSRANPCDAERGKASNFRESIIARWLEKSREI
jgi:hypothetical protein